MTGGKLKLFLKIKGPLRVLLKISPCTEKGLPADFCVTIFAENQLMSFLNPYLLFQRDIIFLMEPNQN